MQRIFLTLAAFAVLFMSGVLLLGLTLGDLRPDADEATRNWATVHRLSGVVAALTVVFVDSIVVTYFIGTSRWCKEVVETYQLDREFIRKSTLLKRRTFPVALCSMLAVTGVVALGGAADTLHGKLLLGFTWPQWHLGGAMLGLTFVTYAFFIQGAQIVEQVGVIHTVMVEVRRIRQEKGLDVEDHPRS